MAKANVFYRVGAVFERRDAKRIQALYLLRKQQKVAPRLGMALTVRSKAILAGRIGIESDGTIDPVNADEVKVKHFTLARLPRDRLQQIPRKLAPQIVAAVVEKPDQRAVENLPMEAIREALMELTQ